MHFIKIYKNDFYSREKRTWFLTLEDGKWNSTRGPDMITDRSQHACNSFTYKINNELILAVVGGALSTDYPFNEFLAYGSEDPQWSNNNTELDIPLENYDYGHLLLANGETLFYINTFFNIFYRLTLDFNGYKWVEMNMRLETPRQFAIGVLIPNELTNCTKTAV